MGLINFLKNELTGAVQAAASSDAVKNTLQQHGLNPAGLNVNLDGDKVTLSGSAPTTEDAEKMALTVGNTMGVAKVDNQITPANPTPPSAFYTVKSGDTLWKIAEMHFGAGHGARYTEIVQANTPPIRNPNLIQPGWVLRLPTV